MLAGVAEPGQRRWTQDPFSQEFEGSNPFPRTLTWFHSLPFFISCLAFLNLILQSFSLCFSEVEITGEEGISQKDHMRIIDDLYEETIRLRRDLNDE